MFAENDFCQMFSYLKKSRVDVDIPRNAFILGYCDVDTKYFVHRMPSQCNEIRFQNRTIQIQYI